MSIGCLWQKINTRGDFVMNEWRRCWWRCLVLVMLPTICLWQRKLISWVDHQVKEDWTWPIIRFYHWIQKWLIGKIDYEFGYQIVRLSQRNWVSDWDYRFDNDVLASISIRKTALHIRCSQMDLLGQARCWLPFLLYCKINSLSKSDLATYQSINDLAWRLEHEGSIQERWRRFISSSRIYP